MSERDVVIRVDGVSKLYRLGEVGTGSLAHDVNRWWHKVRGLENPYLKIGEVNDRTKSVSSDQRPESSAKNAKPHDTAAPALDSRRARLWNAEHIPPGSSLDSSGSAQALDSGPSSLDSSSKALDPGLSTSSSEALDARRSSLDSPPSLDMPVQSYSSGARLRRGSLNLGR